MKEYASDYYINETKEICLNAHNAVGKCVDVEFSYVPLIYPAAGIENYWKVLRDDEGTFNGDVCQPGHFCPGGSRIMTPC